jgi:hypothetical protein
LSVNCCQQPIALGEESMPLLCASPSRGWTMAGLGESVLVASMMAELIVTKKEIASQLKKSTGTSRATPKSPGAGSQRLPLAGRHGAGQSIRWFLGLGHFWRRGSLSQLGRRLKGRSERTRRRGHESFKAIRKFCGTGKRQWSGHAGLHMDCGASVQPGGALDEFTLTRPRRTRLN